ncbi:MAG: hypothetical protein HY869_03485 [Chloroflexi bacterium]|nr:hypothetical protein [Chloroflexota bacterium]
MDTVSKFLTPGIVFLLTLGFGLWLSLAGRPYNGLLFNVHKLAALGAVILAGIQVYALMKGLSPQGWLTALTVIAVLCVLALFASGAFMSIGNLNYQAMLTIHRIALPLEFIAMAGIIALLAGKTL